MTALPDLSRTLQTRAVDLIGIHSSIRKLLAFPGREAFVRAEGRSSGDRGSDQVRGAHRQTRRIACGSTLRSHRMQSCALHRRHVSRSSMPPATPQRHLLGSCQECHVSCCTVWLLLAWCVYANLYGH